MEFTLAKAAEKALRATKPQCHNIIPTEADSSGDKYVEERIVRYEDDQVRTKYLVPWYGYRPADNT